MSSERHNKTSIKEYIKTMNANTIGIIACVAVLLVTLGIFFAGRGNHSPKKSEEETIQSPIPVEAIAQAGNTDVDEVTVDTPADHPWKTMTDDEYNVKITVVENGYSGKFVEDGTDDEVKKIWALTFTNTGSQDIQYGEYVFGADGEAVSFRFSNLSAGQSCKVLESARRPFKKKELLELKSRVVAAVDEIPFAREELLVVDNNDDSITIMNLTDHMIPLARVFYKTYDSKQEIFLGGVTYNVKAEEIPAGNGVTVVPAHFHSGDSLIVGSEVYNKES